MVSILKCHGLRDGKACEATSFCKAHIIPRAFVRHVRRGNEIILVRTEEGIRKPAAQDGVFDSNILCQDCDNKLGEFDRYAIEFCRSFNAKAVRHATGWEIGTVDGERLAKFFLAVLWRASISSRPEFSTTRLGPYENRARDVLYGVQSLASMPGFIVTLARLEAKAANVEGLITLPTRLENHWGFNGYEFVLGGFFVLAKVDQRRSPLLANEFVVNGAHTLMGTYQDFEDTPQFREMASKIWHTHLTAAPGKRWVRP